MFTSEQRIHAGCAGAGLGNGASVTKGVPLDRHRDEIRTFQANRVAGAVGHRNVLLTAKVAKQACATWPESRETKQIVDASQ